MATKVNDIKLSFAVEDSLGTLPGTPLWYETDRLTLDEFGSSISRTEIRPINQNAMDEKPIITDLDSSVAYTNNLTISSLKNHIQGAFRSDIQSQAEAVPTSILASDDSFNHAALSGAIAEHSLIYARNLSDTSNDGLHVVGAASTTTKTITTSTLADQSSIPANARFNVVGYQGTSGDIELDSDNNLISTTLDFTTLGLTVGQSLWIGGSTSVTQFATADYTGLVRVKIVEANKITIEERPWTVGAADAGTGKTIQIFFGDFIRNVPRDDSDYNAESYTFEGEFPDMASSTTYYEYPDGNRVNECTLSFPQTDKATVSWNFMGLDTPNITSSQASGNRLNTYDKKGFGTSSDCVFLKVKDTDLTDFDTTFTDLTLTISNNINPRKALCNLGAVDINDGNFMMGGSVQAFINDPDMINSVRNNDTLVLSYAVDNEDGVLDIYLPAMTFGSKAYDTPENDNALVNFDIMTYKDEFYGFVAGFTMYHYLPI